MRERVNIFTLRESVHTVGIEGRMVSVDVMSVCVQLTCHPIVSLDTVTEVSHYCI